MSTARIVTTTKPELREVDVTTERVHLDVSIQEAHYLLNLLGSSHPSIARLHGLSEVDGGELFNALRETLGWPEHRLYPQLDVVEL